MRIKGTDKRAVERLNAASGELRAYTKLYPDATARVTELVTGLAERLAEAGIELSLEVAETAEAAARRLNKRFGLTPAEARLALHVADGGTLPAFAKSHGLSRHTVRNQMQSIFQKTGVRRQAELVKLLAG